MHLIRSSYCSAKTSRHHPRVFDSSQLCWMTWVHTYSNQNVFWYMYTHVRSLRRLNESKLRRWWYVSANGINSMTNQCFYCGQYSLPVVMKYVCKLFAAIVLHFDMQSTSSKSIDVSVVQQQQRLLCDWLCLHGWVCDSSHMWFHDMDARRTTRKTLCCAVTTYIKKIIMWPNHRHACMEYAATCITGMTELLSYLCFVRQLGKYGCTRT